MKNIILLFIPLSLLIHTAAIAQNEGNQNAGASQSATLVLSNGIDISYMATGSGEGNEANMQFENPNDYASGVTSPDQELRVRSNRTFKVAVRCDANSFSYQGSSKNKNNVTSMPENSLWLKVTGNNTGGNVKAPFSTSGYASLSTTSQDLLVDGSRGGNQTFSVMYKCTPGFNLPAGTYAMNVVYTATQQ